MTTARILIMGAGSAGAENLIRSLRAADSSLVLLGCNDDRFVLRCSAADARYLVPQCGDLRFAPALLRVLKESHARGLGLAFHNALVLRYDHPVAS